MVGTERLGACRARRSRRSCAQSPKDANHTRARGRLTAAELAARARSDARDAALIVTAAYAGLRLGELRALHWRDVDFERPFWVLTSGGECRTVTAIRSVFGSC